MSVQNWIDQALELSEADDCVVLVEERTEANLRWAGNSLTTNGQMHNRTLTVIAFAEVQGGTANGVVSGPLTRPKDIEPLVRAAERAARTASPSDDAMPLVEGLVDPDFGLPAAPTSIEVFADFAPALGRAFGQARKDGQLLYGFAEHIVATSWLASSAGVRCRFVQPTGRVELNLKSPDLSRSAWVGQATTDFTDVDADRLFAEVVTRHGWSEHRIELPAGRYETLLPPSAVADLLIDAYWSASARDAEEGRSAFSAGPGKTRIGERLSQLPLTLFSDPQAAGVECAPFVMATSSMDGLFSVFDNGAPVERVDWLRDGTWAELVRTRSHAAKTGSRLRAPADNLILDGQSSVSLAEMIKSTKRGLLLTCLWYIREVDPQTLLLTGLTRDWVYLIEDGEVKGAVNNFRFNESPIDLLSRISEVSRAEKTLPREWSDWFSRTVMPAVRVPDFNMSTISRAS